MRFKALANSIFYAFRKEQKREEESEDGIYESYNDRESRAFLGIDLRIIKINKRICKM